MNHHKGIQQAYDNVVDLYASLFDNQLEAQPFSKAIINTFVELVHKTGNVRVADVGCGPGHITAMLHEQRLDVSGLDLSPAMIKYARRHHPGPHFEQAGMEKLPFEDGALGGVLAHYSMIHTPPEKLPALLKEQARVLVPNGLLLISFFATSKEVVPVRFNHQVTPAFSWPTEHLDAVLSAAGFDTFAKLIHNPESERGFLDAHLLARRQRSNP